MDFTEFKDNNPLSFELKDPVKWVKETGTYPCDPMWIGRTRYLDKAEEIFEAYKKYGKI